VAQLRARVAEAEQAVTFPVLLLVALSTRDIFTCVFFSNRVFFAAQSGASAPKCAVHHREEPGAVVHLYIILCATH
jgi:hypothetical protein